MHRLARGRSGLLRSSSVLASVSGSVLAGLACAPLPPEAPAASSAPPTSVAAAPSAATSASIPPATPGSSSTDSISVKVTNPLTVARSRESIALSAADLAGTWHGIVKAEGTDSIINRFTAVRSTDSTGKTISEGQKDSVAYSVRYDADSMIATSAPYTDPTLPKGTPRVMYRSVGRLKDGKLVGTSALMLASKPDSVIARSTWEATRTP